MANVPAELKYTREHEWARVDGKIVTIGITRFAVEQLGDITQVDLPKEGERITKEQVFGTVESVKAVSDLYAPVSGTVSAINEDLTSAPEKINTDANTTWLIKIMLSDPSQIDALLTAEAYDKFVSEETGH